LREDLTAVEPAVDQVNRDADLALAHRELPENRPGAAIRGQQRQVTIDDAEARRDEQRLAQQLARLVQQHINTKLRQVADEHRMIRRLDPPKRNRQLPAHVAQPMGRLGQAERRAGFEQSEPAKPQQLTRREQQQSEQRE